VVAGGGQRWCNSSYRCHGLNRLAARQA
jgi:hypothetical protein